MTEKAKKGLKPKLKAEWLKWLRSGKYEQCEAALYDGKGFCCLGVLCDIAVSGEWEYNENTMTWLPPRSARQKITAEQFDNREHHLSEEAYTRLGLTKGDWTDLADMNDTGSTFKDIADYIESEL